MVSAGMRGGVPSWALDQNKGDGCLTAAWMGVSRVCNGPWFPGVITGVWVCCCPPIIITESRVLTSG